jgi:hypothetical protein
MKKIKNFYENKMLAMGGSILLRLVEIMATKEYEEYHSKMDEYDECICEEYSFDQFHPVPMWRIPESIRNIIGMSNETYNLKNLSHFQDIMESVYYFDFGCNMRFLNDDGPVGVIEL